MKLKDLTPFIANCTNVVLRDKEIRICWEDTYTRAYKIPSKYDNWYVGSITSNERSDSDGTMPWLIIEIFEPTDDYSE